jgi:hypothetical protein
LFSEFCQGLHPFHRANQAILQNICDILFDFLTHKKTVLRKRSANALAVYFEKSSVGVFIDFFQRLVKDYYVGDIEKKRAYFSFILNICRQKSVKWNPVLGSLSDILICGLGDEDEELKEIALQVS